MKRRLLVVSAAIAATAVMAILGYLILSGAMANRPNQALIPIADAAIVYDDAAAAVAAAENVKLTISKTKETTVQTHTFLEITQQSLSYLGLGSENMRANLEETLTIGSHSVSIRETYLDGIGYTAMENSYFSSPMSAAEYQERFVPLLLLDPALYSSITGVDSGDTYILSFENASDPETWALEEGSVFIEARGTAYVTHDGQLSKSVYAVTYSRGNAQIRMTVTAETAPYDQEIHLPANISEYIHIDYLDGPRQLERASGYLVQANNVTSRYIDSTYVQAFGDSRTQEITLHTHRDDHWSALVETCITDRNDSRADQASQLDKTELFNGSEYFVSTNGSNPQPDTEVDVDEMYSYCQNLLVSTVMLPQYISSAQLTHSDAALRIHFGVSDAFTQLIRSNACQALYQDPALLDTLAQSNTADTIECYLELDQTTGLPLAAGILFNGTTTIEGLSYELHFQADQTYDLTSQEALTEINKAAGA